MARHRNKVEGPKWAGLSSFLREAAWAHDLDIEIHKERGWVRETAFYTVTGDEADIWDFREEVIISLEAYNSR